MSIVDDTKLKVQSYLTQLGSPQLDADGDLSLRLESARVFVRVQPFGDDQSIVTVFCFVLRNVPLTNELYQYVAVEGSYRFGRLFVLPSDQPGVGSLMMDHTLLGTYLDPDELLIAVSLVAGTANKLDDELKSRFGGERFHED